MAAIFHQGHHDTQEMKSGVDQDGYTVFFVLEQNINPMQQLFKGNLAPYSGKSMRAGHMTPISACESFP